MYTYIESSQIYTIKIKFSNKLNNFLNDATNWVLYSTWFSIIQSKIPNVVKTTIIDIYTSTHFFNIKSFDEWCRNFITNNGVSGFIASHPELILVHNQTLIDYIFNTNSIKQISFFNFNNLQLFNSAVLYFPQFLFISHLIFMIISFYMTYYTTQGKEESTIDSDYTWSSLSVESEKELGPLDDLLTPIITIVYLFGCYFYIFCWNTLNLIPELSIIIFLFIVLYYIILFMPVLLLYDFGIVYTCYIRGIAPSNLLISELFYDYAAILTFFIRIVAQIIRLILMYVTYALTHDYIVYNDFLGINHMTNDTILEIFSQNNYSLRDYAFHYFVWLPNVLMKHFFEIVHLFFVITGQFIAYISTIFWLFLYLFTTFIIEFHEKFLKERRVRRKKIQNIIQNIRKTK